MDDFADEFADPGVLEFVDDMERRIGRAGWAPVSVGG
jgi:hypothetical protein